MIRQEQCDKVCRILDDVLANRPKERDSLIVATRKAFETLEGAKWVLCSERLPKNGYWLWSAKGGEVQKDFYWDGHWENAEKYGYEVMAWMPLPEPAKEDDYETD